MTTAALALADFLLARITEDEWGIRQVEKREQDMTRVDLWFGYPLVGRVLAECEAKRRIVAWELQVAERAHLQPEQRVILQLLALPYADHPDYRQEWRP